MLNQAQGQTPNYRAQMETRLPQSPLQQPQQQRLSTAPNQQLQGETDQQFYSRMGWTPQEIQMHQMQLYQGAQLAQQPQQALYRPSGNPMGQPLRPQNQLTSYNPRSSMAGGGVSFSQPQQQGNPLLMLILSAMMGQQQPQYQAPAQSNSLAGSQLVPLLRFLMGFR